MCHQLVSSRGCDYVKRRLVDVLLGRRLILNSYDDIEVNESKKVETLSMTTSPLNFLEPVSFHLSSGKQKLGTTNDKQFSRCNGVHATDYATLTQLGHSYWNFTKKCIKMHLAFLKAKLRTKLAVACSSKGKRLAQMITTRKEASTFISCGAF